MDNEHAEKLTEALAAHGERLTALTSKVEELCSVVEKTEDWIASGIGMLGEDETVLAIRRIPVELREARKARERRGDDEAE